MNKDSIRISEKHGVNPSMMTCFYCGEVTGIALMGKLPGDAEAPRQCCCSVEPCDKCKEKFKDYVLMVEAQSSDSKDPQPTGRWFALKKEALNPMYRNSPIAFMLEQDFQQVLNNFNKGDKE